MKKFRLNKTVKYYCIICANQSCDHIEIFMDWMKTIDTIEIFHEVASLADFNKEEAAMCISHKKIPYPLPENLRLIHTAYEAGERQFPSALVPKFDATKTCKHGNIYSSEDPITSGWFLSNDVVIHKFSSSVMLCDRKLFLSQSCWM